MGKRHEHFTKDIVMANEHMRRYSISLVIRKIQMETTTDTTFYPLEWHTTLNIGKDIEQLEL